MTYPSNPQEYPPTGPGAQESYQGYQGYPAQPGYPSSAASGYPAQPGYQSAYPPQAPYPPQGAYPPGYPPQPPYPPQQGYAQPGYAPQPGYPPAAYGQQPYAQPPMHGAPAASPFAGAQARPKARNPLATRALIYGALSLGVNIVGLFLGYFLTGIAAAFTIYYSIRALVYAGKLPGKEGTGAAIAGLVLAVLSLLISIVGYVVQFSR